MSGAGDLRPSSEQARGGRDHCELGELVKEHVCHGRVGALIVEQYAAHDKGP